LQASLRAFPDSFSEGTLDSDEKYLAAASYMVLARLVKSTFSDEQKGSCGLLQEFLLEVSSFEHSVRLLFFQACSFEFFSMIHAVRLFAFAHRHEIKS
jgi:hypothetical protein